MNHVIHLDKENKGNKQYFKVKLYTVKFTISGAHYDFQNLFNGDKRLGDNILKVINDNWNAIFEDINDGINKSYSKVFETIAKVFFSKIPIDNMFPK